MDAIEGLCFRFTLSLRIRLMLGGQRSNQAGLWSPKRRLVRRVGKTTNQGRCDGALPQRFGSS